MDGEKMIVEQLAPITVFVSGVIIGIFCTCVYFDSEKANAKSKHLHELIEKMAKKLDVQ
jgi:hypothetical protein